jgi:hypothetical protein
MCREAVKRNGSALEFVPRELKTKELCFEAVMRNIQAFEYVPDEFKTAELNRALKARYNL